jgi:hypothetical protein
MEPKLKSPETERLKLKCDILLSTSAFKINLRRYNMVVSGEPSSAFFEYERTVPTGQTAGNSLDRPTGAPVVDVELVGGGDFPLAEFGISLPAPSADALLATLYGHSTWRPLSRAER